MRIGPKEGDNMSRTGPRCSRVWVVMEVIVQVSHRHGPSMPYPEADRVLVETSTL